MVMHRIDWLYIEKKGQIYGDVYRKKSNKTCTQLEGLEQGLAIDRMCQVRKENLSECSEHE